MGYISVGEEKLHYLVWGSGKRLLLAFHGYGNDAAIFNPFVDYLNEAYTILSFDLPHHGNSKWTEGTPLTKKDLVALVDTLKEQYKVDKISLLGYSMGGRICLTIVECVPASIDKVVLIATDGMTVNFYYYFFTRTYFGRKLFRYMLEKPDSFLNIIDWLRKKNLVDASRHKFFMNYLRPEPSRKFLLQVWPGLRHLVPSPAKLKQAIRKHHIPVSIFMGTYDKIMPPSLAEKFKTGLDTAQLYILEKGHRVFDNENAQQIAERLL